jgi:hypothetical protein
MPRMKGVLVKQHGGDGYPDGWTDGRTDRRKEGRTDGRNGFPDKDFIGHWPFGVDAQKGTNILQFLIILLSTRLTIFLTSG